MERGVKGDEDSYSSILLKYLGTFTFAKNKHTAISNKLNKKDA